MTTPPRARRVTLPQLSGRPRKFVRATHIAVSAGWLGLVVAMLTLGISAATAPDPTFSLACYAMMERIGGAVIPFFAVATLVTGIVLSVATPWRLFQYWWVIVKLVLTVTVIVTAVALTGDWVQQAVAQAAGASRAADGSNAGLAAWLVVAGSVVHLLFLWPPQRSLWTSRGARPGEVAERRLIEREHDEWHAIVGVGSHPFVPTVGSGAQLGDVHRRDLDSPRPRLAYSGQGEAG